MENEKYISFFSHKKKIIIDIAAICYAIQDGRKVRIHTLGGEIYETRLPIYELEKMLGEEYVKIKRNTIVKISAIESIADSVHLKNGDMLKFAARQKQRIIDDVLRITAQESED